jgi:3-hydroxybutyryl-CoA dehydrogenase
MGSDMKKVTVIGTGTMGNGIAHVLAINNYQVNLVGTSMEKVDKAVELISGNIERQVKKELISPEAKALALSRIVKYVNLADSIKGTSMVIEAITEDKEMKIELFSRLGELCTEEVILASNTSSISLTEIAAKVKFPERVIGVHFMSPVPVMKLVEIIAGKLTNDATKSAALSLCNSLKKEPVLVNDAPGFIANRILMPMINEAILSLEDGVSGVEEIDTIMKLGMSHPIGPLQLADLIGLDVCYSILMVMAEGLGAKYKPSSLLKSLVDSGTLGVKTGEGFYIHTRGSKELIVSPKFL